MELAVSDVKEHRLDLSTTWRNLHNPTSPCEFQLSASEELVRERPGSNRRTRRTRRETAESKPDISG